MNEELDESEITEARRLLGDVVHDTIQRSEVATLLRSRISFTGCARRREMLNRFHERITQTVEERKGTFRKMFEKAFGGG